VIVALALAIVLVALVSVTVFAVDPTPEASGLLIDPLDPRAGAGANRVGAPFLALVAVVAIGLVSALATALYVRISRAR
jgi:hypothetical protein